MRVLILRILNFSCLIYIAIERCVFYYTLYVPPSDSDDISQLYIKIILSYSISNS